MNGEEICRPLNIRKTRRSLVSEITDRGGMAVQKVSIFVGKREISSARQLLRIRQNAGTVISMPVREPGKLVRGNRQLKHPNSGLCQNLWQLGHGLLTEAQVITPHTRQIDGREVSADRFNRCRRRSTGQTFQLKGRAAELIELGDDESRLLRQRAEWSRCNGAELYVDGSLGRLSEEVIYVSPIEPC